MPACRAGAWPVPAARTHPMMTCSTSSFRMPLRATASATATAPSFGAGTSARDPMKLPTAVLAAPAITTSFIGDSFGGLPPCGSGLLEQLSPEPDLVVADLLLQRDELVDAVV